MNKKNTIENDVFYKILPKNNEKLIISLSGGVDSVVLTHILYKKKYNISCLHFNHKKRIESEEEEIFVKKLCKKLNIELKVIDVNLKNNQNFQASARNFRYEKLKKFAKENNTKYILTAHHLDDQIETILLKIIRGSNLQGYSGIKDILKTKDDFIFLRPFLNINKDDIYSYASNYNIEYRQDNSNFEKDYLRNKIRLDIIPLLKENSGNIYEAVKTYSKQLSLSYNFINKLALEFINDKDKIKIKDFLKEDIVIKQEILSILLNKKKINVSFTLINDLINVIENKKPNLTYSLSDNYLLIKEYDFFKIKQKTKSCDVTFFLKEKSKSKEKIYYSFKDENFKMPCGKIKYNEEDILFPLIARKKENGDILEFHYGNKKLSRFLIDKKVKKEVRDNLLIVVDSNNKVLWIPDLYLNQVLDGKNTLYLNYQKED